MVRVLFWKTKRNRVERALSDLVHEHEVDLLVLAENGVQDEAMLPALNIGSQRPFLPVASVPNLHRPITMFSRLPIAWVQPVRDQTGISVRRLRLPSSISVNLIAVHLPSKREYSDSDQGQLVTALVQLVDEVEREGEHRTVIVGDFNMNPFEDAIVGHRGLHAVASRSIAKREGRTVQQEYRRYFYNPMWSHFGDRLPSPPGTQYYQSSRPVAHFWNMFDMALFRPELLPHLDDESIRIATTAGVTSLLGPSGRPDPAFSDHLPIVFTLNI